MSDLQGQAVFECFNPGFRPGQKTSEKADEDANEKFKARHCQLVYTAVRCYCNKGTAREIAKAGQDNGLEITHDMVWRRLHDLKDHEYLRNGDDRKSKISGRKVKTWFVTKCGSGPKLNLRQGFKMLQYIESKIHYGQGRLVVAHLPLFRKP